MIKLRYELILKDKNGKIIRKEKRISKSLLRAFMLWLYSKFTMTASGQYAATWSVTNISGTAVNFPRSSAGAESQFGFFGAASGDANVGIRIGKSSQTVTPTDYELIQKIAHGTGLDQMLYGTQTLEAVQTVGNVSSFRFTRPFTNNSGATIIVKEIGAAWGQVDSNGTMQYVLYLRDVLPSPIPVPDGATLTVRYIISVTT